ncbi:MAG: hypothetical protein HOP35_10565 [Nitrospira sp.]|nr:hypothetical protein [Nitrospira sp.]
MLIDPNWEHQKDHLLQEGYLLTQQVIHAIASTKSLPLNIRETFTRKNIKSHQAKYDELFHQFVEYDKRVSQFIPIFDAPTPVNAGAFFTVSTYSSQLCQPRDNLRALLKDYCDRISGLNNDANNRLTMWGMYASIVVAVVSLGVSLVALKLTLLQTDITVRQDETNRLLFSKSSKLKLHVATDIDAFANFNIGFLAHNTGNRSTAQGFYYRLIIPAEIIEPRTERLGNADNSILLDAKMEHLTLQGNKLVSFGGFQRDPLFPGRKLRLGNLSLKRPTREIKVLWQFTTEDGVVPSENDYGELIIPSGSEK